MEPQLIIDILFPALLAAALLRLIAVSRELELLKTRAKELLASTTGARGRAPAPDAALPVAHGATLDGEDPPLAALAGPRRAARARN